MKVIAHSQYQLLGSRSQPAKEGPGTRGWMQKRTMIDVSHIGNLSNRPHQQRPQQAGQVPQQRSTNGGRDKPVAPEMLLGGIISLFSKVIKKRQRTDEYTSNRVITPSKVSCSSRTSHKPRQLDVSRGISSARASVQERKCTYNKQNS